MKAELIEELAKAAAGLREGILAFSPEQFRQQPAAGWSAAQTAEHILKSVAGIPALLKGHNVPANRDPLEKLPTIKGIFLDFSTKMQSPEFILPSPTPPSQNELNQQLNQKFDEVKETAGSAELENLFTEFPFPGIGEFTGYEWLAFVTAHTQRHTVQIGKIYQGIAEKEISV